VPYGWRARFVALVAIVVAASGCGGSKVELHIDTSSNPDLTIQGQLWETDNTIPDKSRFRKSVAATSRIQIRNNGVFTGPGGFNLTYSLATEEFRSHDCFFALKSRRRDKAPVGT